MLIPDYKALWLSMEVNPLKIDHVQLSANHIKQFLTRYQSVGTFTCPLSPIPWYFIGLIHHMESGQNFNTHLYNGDPLTARTVQVPKGRPEKGEPPFAWEYSAQSALIDMGFGSPKIWQTDDTLARLETYNGLGYRKHDILSPYVWAGTNHYDKGYFTSDGKFNPDVTSGQIGCAAILKYLLPQ